MKYHIDGITPSQNKIDRMHWSEKTSLRDEWYWLVKQAVGIKKNKETKPVFLHIVRVSKRLIDDGNLPSGCKYLIDALVQFDHAVDDSHKWMRITYNQRKCTKDENPHMEITLCFSKDE